MHSTDAKRSFEKRVPKRSMGTRRLFHNPNKYKHFGRIARKRNASKSLHLTKGKCSL
jgi:hypothetical protein